MIIVIATLLVVSSHQPANTLVNVTYIILRKIIIMIHDNSLHQKFIKGRVYVELDVTFNIFLVRSTYTGK